MPTASNASVVQRARGAGLALGRALEWAGPLLARLVVGLVFTLSGWGKLHNLDNVIEYFSSLGIPAARYQAPFASAMELACGVAVLLGLCTRLAALPLIVIMVVALKTALAEDLAAAEGALDWLNVLFGLPEFLYIVLCAWLAVAGAGAVSLDRLLFRRAAG
jgi:putative oxidoreductase